MEVLQKWLLWLAILITDTKTSDVNDAWCTVPSVAEGGSTSLTCYFKDNLNETKKDFYVQLDQHGQFSDILSCQWMDSDRPTCDIKAGYEFNGRISNTLILTIPSATELHVGGYMCLVALSVEAIPCNFSLTDTGLSEVINQTSIAFQNTYQAPVTTLGAGMKDNTKHNKQGGNHVTVIAIAIPVLLVAICLAVVFMCRKRLLEHFSKCMIGERRKTNECSEENDQTQFQPLVTIEDSVSPTTTQPSDQPVDQFVSPDTFSGSEVISVTENTKTTGQSLRIPASQDKTTRAKSPEVTGKKKKNLFSGYLYNRAVQLLEKTRAVVITGPEKRGKSALGMHVFNYFMEKGLVPLALGDLSQWPEKRQDYKDHVVLLDEFKIGEQSAKTLSSMLLDEHCYIIFIVQSDAMNKECREGGISISLKTLPVVEFVKQVPTDTKRLKQLFEACHKNNVEQVVTLLSGGVDPDRADGEGKTPLRIACEHGHEYIVAQLISARCDVNSQDIHECAPLHIACEHGHLNVVENLLWAGCDVNARDNTNSTPLHYACKCSKQSRDDAVANDDKDPSPSHESYESPRETVVKRLIASGASLDAVDNEGRTPLHLACESNNYAMVKILLQEGADVEAKDDEGQTPLHVACQHNSRPIVKSLICAKSDVNAKDKEGLTPLHLACAMNANDSVEMLLNANASVEESAEDGMMPLHCACYARNKEIIQMLLNKGADIHVIDNQGRTPESVETSEGHMDINYLVSTAADETPSQTSVSIDQQLPLDFE